MADFFQVLSYAEKFAQSAGWKYFPSAGEIQQIVLNGWTGDEAGIYRTFSINAGIAQSMPWTAVGMTETAYNTQSATMNESVMALTGKGDWISAGLDPAVQRQAMQQNWSQTQIQQFIEGNPALHSQYGYLNQGYTYDTFQQYKTTNNDKLNARYGTGYTDANVISGLDNPLAQFNASGGAFSYNQSSGQQTSSSNRVTGQQSAVR
jgi:hypothetical protein